MGSNTVLDGHIEAPLAKRARLWLRSVSGVLGADARQHFLVPNWNAVG